MNPGIVKILIIIFSIGWSSLSHGLDKEEKSAIKAIKTGDVESLRSYLEEHPGANCLFSNGKSGLYYAIEYDKPGISRFLLEQGANPNHIVEEYPLLIWAVKHNKGRIARLLIEYGADVDKPDKKRNTPLIFAAKMHSLEMCKILVDRGANPLLENEKGNRAIDYQAYNDQSPVFRYLLTVESTYRNRDTVPSMQDGPYFYWESEDQLVVKYYERNQEKNLTRLIEKSMILGEEDTVVEGIGWDTNTYHIQHHLTPDPFLADPSSEIFAVGDVHGRYYALANLFKNNNIIDSLHNWAFGDGQLVMLGDVFDRGAYVTETLWFLYELDIQARQAGGNVHVLLGNHEVMALTGDHRYINDKYYHFTQYTQVPYYQLFERNTVLGRWLRSQNMIVGIDGYIFMHAGISPQFAIYDYPCTEVNERVQQYLYSDYKIKKGSPEANILGPFGPQWFRGYMELDNISPVVTQGFIDNYLDSRGLKRMILGHNEQLNITSHFNGRVISVDVKIDASGTSAQGLLISGDNIFICKSDGSRLPVE